ncbi:uncharacterized protein LOC121734859 [Aricia agestis]|uniref:uncharacterized protein LOC121734859 n=1 Tax=Aricia agestis TaxID=91739 RepID=UPI001C202B35|nr:uncharacterized protein LOC121734859 [Aricia agestis]XP_041981432.1 uncharacterized protein LOC121734859 [Aricia agestis]
MEQIQVPASSSHHLVQVYHTAPQTLAKISYSQIGSEMHIPVTSQIKHDIAQHMIPQNQTVMCQPMMQEVHQSIQTLHQHVPSQVLQNDIQPLQITSHVILPQVLKQHLDIHQYYGQYETYIKDSFVVTKVGTDITVLIEAQDNSKEKEQLDEPKIEKIKRTRSQIPNPNEWACNVRKLKHQRGEAYINRRGKFVPERQIRNTKDCLKSCRYKCNERINDVDRQHIFKAFYSLNSNEKKHFLLNTTERNNVKSNKMHENNLKRKYSFKYFFLVRGVRHTVCKNFYLGTLAISQKPVYNVHMSKSDMNIPKPDGRGLSESSTHSLPAEIKDRVRKHIMSFATVDSKPIKQFSRKKQYLECNLSIKQMYSMYVDECSKDFVETVKESMYRKIFKQEFNLHFKRDKSSQLCCRCKEPVKGK